MAERVHKAWSVDFKNNCDRHHHHHLKLSPSQINPARPSPRLAPFEFSSPFSSPSPCYQRSKASPWPLSASCMRFLWRWDGISRACCCCYVRSLKEESADILKISTMNPPSCLMECIIPTTTILFLPVYHRFPPLPLPLTHPNPSLTSTPSPSSSTP